MFLNPQALLPVGSRRAVEREGEGCSGAIWLNSTLPVSATQCN